MDYYVERHTIPNHVSSKALTHREQEVLQLIAEGKSAKEIADQLNIGIKTAEKHRQNLMNKLQLKSTAELTK